MIARPGGARAAGALAVGLLLGVCLAACSGAAGAPDLNGRAFTATEVRGQEAVEGSTITLTFEDNQVSAQAGCNTLFGPADWEGGTLEIDGTLASTMMACDDALMAQDQWLSEFLSSSPALSLDGDTLTLGDDTTGLTLTED